MPLRRARNPKHHSVMPIRASVDGTREAPSVRSPRTMAATFTHQWKKGGLNDMSPSLLRGSVQSSFTSIVHDTTASRGSPSE